MKRKSRQRREPWEQSAERYRGRSEEVTHNGT